MAEKRRDEVKKPLFRDLNSSEDLDDLETSEIESLCMNCGENGVTRLLLTKIPLFREVILMSFSCPHCNYSNSEIQPGAPIQDQAVKYTLNIHHKKDLDRLVVKADSALVTIPHLEFEIPPNTQKGKVSTVESIISQAIQDIEKEQPVREIMLPEAAKKLDKFIQRLKQCLELSHPFVLELDDPAGNSFIENKLAPSEDPHLTVVRYTRSEEQNQHLGITVHTEAGSNSAPSQDEVLTFEMNCPQCQSPTETRMKTVDVPHFKEVIIMATTCDYCGYRSNEVKSGSGMSANGVKLTLYITDISDLSRDILKNQ